MIRYSEKVIDHFKRPRNVGEIEDADGTGRIGDPSCGDFLHVFIKVENETIVDVKYQIRGCPAAIACASVMTELAIGKHVEDALFIEDQDIVSALDGLPEFKLHCSVLSAQALKAAIVDYFEKRYRVSSSNSSDGKEPCTPSDHNTGGCT